ncbi:unnamed protein product [Pleuronectes platessa]|uniref:RBR-type E3 ubiquitin transferase n=1 Tax=Pleuronectes platessa TaxID=8262 RepID=A0A9N7YD76_PLEPL|nr:unnamed protein product [Pleuronectes platessa]
MSLPLSVQGVDKCPSIRACPTCGQRVEHDRTGCKNIICPRCQVEFCFVCLKLTSECLKTSSYFKPCKDGVAPRQTSIPVCRAWTSVPPSGPVPCGRVEHDRTGCKNIICQRCQVEFCFVCLKVTSECLKTSSYFETLQRRVAPRQTSIPVWHHN